EELPAEPLEDPQLAPWVEPVEPRRPARDRAQQPGDGPAADVAVGPRGRAVRREHADHPVDRERVRCRALAVVDGARTARLREPDERTPCLRRVPYGLVQPRERGPGAELVDERDGDLVTRLRQARPGGPREPWVVDVEHGRPHDRG